MAEARAWRPASVRGSQHPTWDLTARGLPLPILSCAQQVRATDAPGEATAVAPYSRLVAPLAAGALEHPASHSLHLPTGSRLGAFSPGACGRMTPSPSSRQKGQPQECQILGQRSRSHAKDPGWLPPQENPQNALQGLTSSTRKAGVTPPAL